jgi:hypothetical protein
MEEVGADTQNSTQVRVFEILKFETATKEFMHDAQHKIDLSDR